MRAPGWSVVVAAACLLAGCVGGGRESCDEGTEGCACFRNGTCDVGLTCASDLCVDLNGGSGGSGAGGEGGSGGDAGSGGSNDAGEGECRVVADASCPLVCRERCNNVDDDCDGVVDNNGAASSCAVPNAEAACFDGVCVLQRCEPDYADCNDDPNDGCETSLPSDPDNCGTCGTACTLLNTEARCVGGECVLGPCLPGFASCDGQPDNGCETNVMTVERCGGCNESCSAQPNALPMCLAGACGIAECVGNFGDCDGLVENGCETPLTDALNCGACEVSCEGLPNATGTCGASGCEGLTCQGDFMDCDGRADNGCEALLSGVDNCGMCGVVCDLPNVANHRCELAGSTGTCRIDDSTTNDGCDPGFADCNHSDTDGCETVLNTTTDCGACGSVCTFPNGIASCETGTCQLVGCGVGTDDCNNDGACDSLVADPNNCGACGNVCGSTTSVCTAGRCRFGICPSGTADCDSNDTDCETDITQAANCGGCDNNCTGRPNTTGGTCASGICQVTCAANFADCDGNHENGCETDLRTNANCGSCGTACAIANATATCATGTCRVATCASTHRDCDMNATSCETNITLPASCGTCSTDCTGKPNTTGAGCNGGMCELTCAPGFRDCDSALANGCEVNITTPANCGGCGTNCSALANVGTTSCNNSSCTIATCASGYANCDGLPSNGCERPINTLTDCGACNAACSFPNSAASCSTGTCIKGACNAGFGDCDMNPANGCEVQLNTTANSGSCGSACGDGEACNNGVCGPASCPTGQSYCGGTTCVRTDGHCQPWPCLNTRPGPSANCGACGQTCPLFGGQCCLQ